MRLTNKLMDELIINIAGDDVPPLIAILKNRKNVSEFKLAETLNITVNQVRNMLYRLYNHNLVSFIRKKDKKKGWYIYYWTLKMKNTKEALLNLKKNQLEEFKKRLNNEESSSFFVCPNRCMRRKFEEAMEFDFRCQECGELMHEQNNKRTIENIRARIKELEDELGSKMFMEEIKPKRKKAVKKKPIKKTAKKKPIKKKPAKKAAVKKKPIKKTAKKKPVKKASAKKTKKKIAVKRKK
jgi:transcription initiation factor TFIIE subunit alpha